MIPRYTMRTAAKAAPEGWRVSVNQEVAEPGTIRLVCFHCIRGVKYAPIRVCEHCQGNNYSSMPGELK